MVGLSNYTSNPAGFAGWGIDNSLAHLSGQQAVDLAKALDIGYTTGPGATGGDALAVESLERYLKVLTWAKQQAFPLWQKIPKTAAYASVRQWNEVSSYGARSGGFVQTSEVPPEVDGTYTRRSANVKFLATTGSVTMQLASVFGAHGDTRALKFKERVMWMLERIEWGLYHGDSSLVFTGEGEEWDGLDSQIAATSFIDLAGDPLDQSRVEQASRTVLENFGFPTDLFLSSRALSDFDQTLFPKQRGEIDHQGTVGLSASAIRTSAGLINLTSDIFLGQTYSQSNPSATASSTQAPAAPQAPTHAVSGTNGEFEKLVGLTSADEYSYGVSLGNRFGESAVTLNAANRAVSAANKVTGVHVDLAVVNPVAVGDFPPEWIGIYRTERLASGAGVPADLSTYYLIDRVPVDTQANGGAAAAYDDVNLTLPNTSTGYMLQMDPEVLELVQLMPLMKADLAFTSLAYRFVVAMFATPIKYAPAKGIRLTNIGNLS